MTGLARTRLLRLFAEARQSSIRRAYRAGENWPPERLSDLSAAYALLLADPRVEVAPLVESYDFLRWIGAAASSRCGTPTRTHGMPRATRCTSRSPSR